MKTETFPVPAVNSDDLFRAQLAHTGSNFKRYLVHRFHIGVKHCDFGALLAVNENNSSETWFLKKSTACCSLANVR